MCTSAGGELVLRVDDTAETISIRLDVYREQTEPLVDFYRKLVLLRTVVAGGTIDEVYERFVGAIS